MNGAILEPRKRGYLYYQVESRLGGTERKSRCLTPRFSVPDPAIFFYAFDMSDIQININSQIYLAQFQSEIGGHISDLRNILRTIEDKSFVSRSQQQSPDIVVHIQASGAQLQPTDAKQRAINNAFLAMIRSVVSFVDRIVAIKRADGQLIKNVPEGTPIGEEMFPFVEEHLDEFYREVAEDTKLSNPTKVGLLDGLPDWVREALHSMFAVRRALEHHSSKSKKDITLKLRQMKLTIGDQEIGKLPIHVVKGGELRMQIAEVNRLFESGTKIMLSELDIENLFFTLQNIVGTAILQTLAPAPPTPQEE